MKKQWASQTSLWNYLKDDFILSGTVGKEYNLRLLKKFSKRVLSNPDSIYLDQDNFMDEIGLFRIGEIVRFSHNHQYIDVLNVFLEKELHSRPAITDFVRSLHLPNRNTLKNAELLIMHGEKMSLQNTAIIASHIADQAFIFQDVGLLCEMHSLMCSFSHNMPVLNSYTFGLISVLNMNLNLIELRKTLQALYPYTTDWIEKSCNYLASSNRSL